MIRDPSDGINKETRALAEAMWQILDDMGINGQCCSPEAKAYARIAYEPFRKAFLEPEYDHWMSLPEAKMTAYDAENER